MIDSLVYITWYLQTIYHSRSRNIHSIEYFVDSAVGERVTRDWYPSYVREMRQKESDKKASSIWIYDNGYNPSISYLLRVLFVYERFWIPFNSRLVLSSTSAAAAAEPSSWVAWTGPFPYWLGFTTFPFFISTIKPAVRGETMASCRSSTWAFLRGEKSV